MDEQQRKAFEAAVERKKQDALEASRAQPNPVRAPKDLGPESQPDLVTPSTSQDDPTPHDKGTRQGQVSAENWNQ
jgi:hypothetical protein